MKGKAWEQWEWEQASNSTAFGWSRMDAVTWVASLLQRTGNECTTFVLKNCLLYPSYMTFVSGDTCPDLAESCLNYRKPSAWQTCVPRGLWVPICLRRMKFLPGIEGNSNTSSEVCRHTFTIQELPRAMLLKSLLILDYNLILILPSCLFSPNIFVAVLLVRYLQLW